MRIINVPHSHQTGQIEDLEQGFTGRRNFDMPPPSGYPVRNGGGGGGYGREEVGRTPNPYLSSNGGRTPGQGITGRTPNPHAAGGRTPGWNQAVTPNPYLAGGGGRTPGWNQAVTPNPYANGGAGGRTPAWGGGVTPNPYQTSPKGAAGGSAYEDAWGGSESPSWDNSGASNSKDKESFGGASPVWVSAFRSFFSYISSMC